jgi:hypothetical protein
MMNKSLMQPDVFISWALLNNKKSEDGSDGSSTVQIRQAVVLFPS